ncbi:MAG TPA: hypothetical protein VG497_03650, partial [Kribbella sp.]|nr:hypothetical protein [Kribbella sp.]
MFDPDGVPDFFPGTTPDVVALTGSELQRIGGEIRTTGESVTSAFEQLKGCYRAPEASTLITSMRPMRTLSGDFGADIWAMGAILQQFGEDMKGPYEQLQQMLARARVFVAKCKQSDAEGKEWQSYDNWVQEENSYHTDTANLLQQMMDIQVEAANEIEALIGGLGWWPDDFTRQKRGLNGGLAYHARAMSSGEGPPPPWGSPEEYDAPWISDVGHSLVGILDGLTTVLGIQWLAQSTGWKWDDDFFQWAFDHPPADMHQMFDAWAEMGNDTLMLLNKIPGVGKLLPDGMSEQLDQRFDDTIRTIGDDWSKGNQTSSVLGVLGLIPIGPTKLAGLTSKVGKLGKVGKLASKVPPVRVAVAGADKFLDFRSRIRSGAIEGTLKIPVAGSVLKGYSHIPILGKSVRLDPHVPLSRPPRLDLPSHATRTSPALVTTRAGALDPHIGDTNHNRWSTDPHDTTPTRTTGAPAHPAVSLPHSPHPGTTVPTHPDSIDPSRPGTTEPDRPGTAAPARPGSGDPARSGPTDPVTPRPADPLDHQHPGPPATPVTPTNVGTSKDAHTGTSNTPGAPSRPERVPADNAAQQPTNGSSDRASGDSQPTGRQPEPDPRRTPETQRTDRNSATEAQRKTDGRTTPDPRHRTEDPHSTEQQHSTQERHGAEERRRTEERGRAEEEHRTREERRRERPAEVGRAHRGDGGSNDPESGVSRNEPVPPIQPTYPIHAGAGESTISNRLEPNRTPDSTTPDRPHQDPSRARASNDRSIRDGLEPNRSTNRHTEPDSLAPHRSDADRLEGHRAEGHRAEGDRVEGDRVEGDGLDKARQSSAGRERVRRESPDAPDAPDAPERRTDDRDARNSSQTDPAPEPLDDADLARLPAPDPALRRADSPRTESRRPVPSHRTSDPETTPRTPRHGAAAAVDEHGRQRREAEDPFARSELGDRRFRASEADHRALAEQGRMHAGKLGEIRERLGRQVGDPDALSETEVTSLERMLIGHDHQDINDAFRAGDRSVEHRPVVRVAVSALNKLPDFHGEVRRGVSFDSADDFKRFLDRYRPGQTAKEPAFTHSAKPAESVKGADDADRWRGAEDFSGGQYSKGRVILHIDSRHGKDLSFMRDPFTGIDEVVHGPHTPFYPTRMPYQDKETGIWHVHARDYGGPVEPSPKGLNPFGEHRTHHDVPETTQPVSRHDVPDPDRTQRIPSDQVRRLDGGDGRPDDSPYRNPDDPPPHDDPDATQPVKHQHTERDTADNKHHDSPEPNNQETHQH